MLSAFSLLLSHISNHFIRFLHICRRFHSRTPFFSPKMRIPNPHPAPSRRTYPIFDPKSKLSPDPPCSIFTPQMRPFCRFTKIYYPLYRTKRPKTPPFDNLGNMRKTNTLHPRPLLPQFPLPSPPPRRPPHFLGDHEKRLDAPALYR
jgi:hypothetical protein